MTTTTWSDLWLRLVLLAAITYACVLLVLSEQIGDVVFDPLGFGPDDGSIAAGAQLDYVRFVFGVVASVLIGWLVTLLIIAMGPLARRERWGWTAVAASTSVWFVVDTSMSLVHGFEGHAAFNVLFAAAFAVPLVSMRPELRR